MTTNKVEKVRINIRPSGKKQDVLVKHLESIIEKTDLKNPKTKTFISSEFGKILSQAILLQFSKSPRTTEGGKVSSNVYWRELKDSYLRNRPDRVKGKVLIDSSNLMNSFQVGSSKFISRINSDGNYEVGTTVEYAKKLNYTWSIINIEEDTLEKLSKTYMEWVTKKSNE